MSQNKLLLLAFLLTIGLATLILASCGDDDDNDDSASDDDDTADDDVVDDDTADDDVVDDDVADDDTTDDDTTDDDTADDDTTDDDTADDDVTPPTDPISVHLTDILTSQNIENATCELINNTNGESFDPPVTTTSGADGFCYFNQVAKGLFSLKITHGDYVDSYAYNFDASVDWELKLVTPFARTMLAVMIGVTLDSSKGVVSGAVNWIPAEGGYADPVGCAVVSDTQESEMFYFDNAGLPTTGRTDTNPANGYYLAVNVTPGSDTFTADTDGAIAEQNVPVIVADSVTYADIFYYAPEFADNPTPAECAK